MTYDEVEYLESLSRMDLRKKERSLEKMQRKQGQHPADFHRARKRQEARIEYIKGVLQQLKRLKERL